MRRDGRRSMGKKNLPRKNDRNVDAVGRSRMDFAVSSRVRAYGHGPCTHTICVHIYRAASPPRIRKRTGVKTRATTYRCASNCRAAKTAVLFTHRTRSPISNQLSPRSARAFPSLCSQSMRKIGNDRLTRAGYASYSKITLITFYYIIILSVKLSPTFAIALCTCSVYI